MQESANLFSSDEQETDCYESHVGRLTPMDIECGVTLKMLFESNEHFSRLEARRERLRVNLEKFGEEIFGGYSRGTFLAGQILELKNEIKKNAKYRNIKIKDLDELCPHPAEGFKKIAAKTKVNGKEKLMGLSASNLNINMFSMLRDQDYLMRYERYILTSFDIYNFKNDGADNDLLDVLAIRQTLHRWKRNKWPNLVLDDLLVDAIDNRTLELQSKFELIYFIILKEGMHVDLPRMKFKYS